MTASKFFSFLTLCSIVGSLVNCSLFGNPAIAGYFLYILSASVLIVGASLFFIKQKWVPTFENPFPLVIITSLVIYYFLQNYLLKGSALTTMHIFLFVDCLLMVTFSMLFKMIPELAKNVFVIIVFLAAAESVVCILQYLDFLPVMDKLFTVTGTWTNPNVTAMFLAMAFPAALTLMFQKGKWYWFLTGIIILALFLLECRTALIGTVIITGLILNNRWQIGQWLRENYGKLKFILTVTISLVVLIFLSFETYNIKKHSADGRILIWKISAGMVMQRPLLGYGLGKFEHDYNLAQGNHFDNVASSQEEIDNSSYVYMAYNEFLQHAVEGGIIAMLILSIFFISLLIKVPGKELHDMMASYAGIAAFTGMSLFNFTIQAVPAMVLMIIYAGCLISGLPVTPGQATYYKKRWLKKSAVTKTAVGLSFICVAVFVFLWQTSLAHAFIQTKFAARLIEDGYPTEAANILEPLQEKSLLPDVYWNTYGKVYLQKKDYPQAVSKFTKALTISSDPAIYLEEAYCYQKMNNIDSAILYASLAKEIVPGQLTPRYALMMLYLNLKDTLAANKIAIDLINMTPKTKSSTADFYKQEAGKLIAAFNKSNGSAN